MCTTDSIGSIKMNELASNKHALKAKHLGKQGKTTPQQQPTIFSKKFNIKILDAKCE